MPGPVVPKVPAEPPKIALPKLGRVQKSLLNGFIEPVQDWIMDNVEPIRLQAHDVLAKKLLPPVAKYVAQAREVVATVEKYVTDAPAWLDKGIDWAKREVSAFKL